MPSPTAKTHPKANLSFAAALDELVRGKKITKLEWGNPSVYGLIDGTFLKLMKDGTIHNWIISELDIAGTDWQVIE